MVTKSSTCSVCLAAGLCATGQLPSGAAFSVRPATAFGASGALRTSSRAAVRSRATRIGSTLGVEPSSRVVETAWASPESLPRRIDPDIVLLETADAVQATSSGQQQQQQRLSGIEGSDGSFSGDVAAVVAVQSSSQPSRRKKRKMKEPELLEGDALINTPKMLGLVYASLGLNALYLLQALSTITSPGQAVGTMVGAFLGYMLADLVSGLLHWSVDNYGNGRTPVFGSTIEAFQGHHVSPWTIVHRPFANNVHKIAYAVLPLLALLRLVNPGPAGVTFGATFLVGSLMSNEFHRYSHMVDPPAHVRVLQSWGVVLTRKQHGLHHSSPFEEKYCIVSGICNAPMDQFRVFRLMERAVYKFNGIEPISWQLDPSLKEEAMSMGWFPSRKPVKKNRRTQKAG